MTLFALATHTSGLPRLPSDFPKLSTIFGHDPYAKLTREDLVASLRRDGPRAKTNAGYDYSNFGVALLGEALAAAWGTSYDEALRAHVLTPLGLQHTTLALAGRDAPKDLAPPHHSAKPVPRWTFATYAPCGALNSPARDLAKFLQAALAGANGKDAPLREAFAVTTKPQHAFPGGTIGLGWHLTDAAKPPVITWHNGGTAGSRCFLGFDANRGTGLVVLTNHDVAVDALAVALLRAAPPPAKPR